MAWTVIQDVETLDGADIAEMSRRFWGWIAEPGRQEMQRAVFFNQEWG